MRLFAAAYYYFSQSYRFGYFGIGEKQNMKHDSSPLGQ